MFEDIIATPWDSRVFGVNTSEILYTSEINLQTTLQRIFKEKSLGHYTIKINPLAPKKILHEFGFYYCDTLIEPYCSPERIVKYDQEGIDISESVNREELSLLSNIIYSTFTYDRFHRDFNINPHLADVRYDLWLQDLWKNEQVFTLRYSGKIAGFWAYSNNKILLHALSQEYKGKGLSKYFWSLACVKLLAKGHQEITSSISASNLAVLNLYSSLGFRFRNAVDIYHLVLE
ncbi:MAG: GNAT family N-acetyltransferase [Dolichospermum sp.]